MVGELMLDYGKMSGVEKVMTSFGRFGRIASVGRIVVVGLAVSGLVSAHGAPYGETALWQAKIDAASAAGGGTVVVGPGDHHVA